MVKKIIFWLIWIGSIAYAFLLAPPDRPETLELIKDLSTGNWEGINPSIISLFNLMGIWPMIYSCLLLFDGREQKIQAWPFVTLSFGIGAFALLPYLGSRDPNPNFSGTKNLLLKILDSRFTAIAITLAASAFVLFGLLNGDWGDFIRQWQTSKFIHVMSLDFCLLCVLFPALLGDDMLRRGMENQILFWVAALIPLFGPLIYLCLRKPNDEVDSKVAATTQQPAAN
ncbi:MAG: DUF2834 domain-containing protein [Cyanobacteriota bacterium]|nr:DUF2834 domain-containing protein [Cyanobacteriota bacterium]